MFKVDLNCDMGEGGVNDSALMKFVSSVNIACGAHAGDAEIMRRTVEQAQTRRIAIGAHPGYPDRENFGRVAMSLTPGELYDLVTGQVSVLQKICATAGARLTHVKPHGALYNLSARDAQVAATVARAVADIDRDLVLYGLSNSVSLDEGRKAGLRTASEAFTDRTYQADGSLTPRSMHNALIGDVRAAADQAITMVCNGNVTSVDGAQVPITPDTICIHGDGDHALEFAEAIFTRLTDAGVSISPV